jgi:hypothetical protein
MPIGQIVASAPPASMMSASSSLIIRAASPIEWAPVEQAVTTAWLGPIRPYLIETWPEMRLISRPWTKCGLTRLGPFSCSTSDSLSIPGRPPMPEPIEQPARSRVLVHVGQAGILDRLAGGVDAVDDERVDLALDLVVDALAGIEAIFVVGRLHLAGDAALLVAGVEAGDRPAPLLPARMFFQVVSTSPPSGVTSPRPVTTTRRMHSPNEQTGSTRSG